ncbi:UNVERIFIED_CONTAM: hypothetical protein K2H54_008430 [Gekko kuhli]
MREAGATETPASPGREVNPSSRADARLGSEGGFCWTTPGMDQAHFLTFAVPESSQDAEKRIMSQDAIG